MWICTSVWQRIRRHPSSTQHMIYSRISFMMDLLRQEEDTGHRCYMRLVRLPFYHEDLHSEWTYRFRLWCSRFMKWLMWKASKNDILRAQTNGSRWRICMWKIFSLRWLLSLNRISRLVDWLLNEEKEYDWTCMFLIRFSTKHIPNYQNGNREWCRDLVIHCRSGSWTQRKLVSNEWRRSLPRVN